MANGAGTAEKEGDDVKRLALYGYPGCPYCRRVLNAISLLEIDVPLFDTMKDDANNAALVAATGRETVPVLRIEKRDGSVHWLPDRWRLAALSE